MNKYPLFANLIYPLILPGSRDHMFLCTWSTIVEPSRIHDDANMVKYWESLLTETTVETGLEGPFLSKGWKGKWGTTLAISAIGWPVLLLSVSLQIPWLSQSECEMQLCSHCISRAMSLLCSQRGSRGSQSFLGHVCFAALTQAFPILHTGWCCRPSCPY